MDILPPRGYAADKQASMFVTFPALAIKSRPVVTTWTVQHCHDDAETKADGRQREIDDPDIFSGGEECGNRVEDKSRGKCRVGFCLAAIDRS